MPSRISTFPQVLKAPAQLLIIMLLTIFLVEAAIMLILPMVLPLSLDKKTEALLDAAILSVLAAPVFWWLLVNPIRQIAISEHARSETIVANAVEGIISFDSSGKILSFNNAASELFGMTLSRALGNSIESLIPDINFKTTGTVQLDQTVGIKEDQTEIPLSVSMGQVPAGSETIYVVIVRDKTEELLLQEERLVATREKEALKTQQMSTLAHLATGVAHEIRNPLTAIKMLIQTNRKQLEKNGTPSEDMELVEQEIRRMERSVNALLEYARPERSQFGDICWKSLLEKTERLIAGRCQSQNVKLTFSIDELPLDLIQGDFDQLQQLTLNLCLNAIDAMPAGGQLKVSLSQDANEVVLQVIDNGSGISEAVQEQLFEPFITTKKEGVGLGLGICRRIAEEHGGRISGFNLNPAGACFELRLPVTI